MLDPDPTWVQPSWLGLGQVLICCYSVYFDPEIYNFQLFFLTQIKTLKCQFWYGESKAAITTTQTATNKQTKKKPFCQKYSNHLQLHIQRWPHWDRSSTVNLMLHHKHMHAGGGCSWRAWAGELVWDRITGSDFEHGNCRIHCNEVPVMISFTYWYSYTFTRVFSMEVPENRIP